MAEKHRHYDSHDAGPEWGTPRWIWKPLARALDGFDLDPASGAEPMPIAPERYTVEDDGLSQPWFGDVWVNPPYGRDHNSDWAERIHHQAERERVRTVTALVPASTETNYFQDHYFQADFLTFISVRVSFIGAGDDGASFPSVIASYGDFPQEYMEALRSLSPPEKDTRPNKLVKVI